MPIRQKWPEFSVQKYEHELSLKVVHVNLKSLQYVRDVLYWSEFWAIQVNIRPTTRLDSTKKTMPMRVFPHRQTITNAPTNKFDIFWKYCSSKLSQIYSIITFY
jgi:hypothetical protein